MYGRESVEIVSLDGVVFNAIGKIVFKTPSVKWNIPHLHFLVRKVETECYESICLDLQQIAYGKDVNHAVGNLVKSIVYVMDAIRKDAKRRRGEDSEFIDILMSPALTHSMDGYWKEFRKIEIDLAKKGYDLGHTMDRYFINTIKDQIGEAFRSQIKQKIGETVDTILDEIWGSILNGIDFDIDLKMLKEDEAA